MVVHNKIVNKPSDQIRERPVSDAMLVFSTAKLKNSFVDAYCLLVLNSIRLLLNSCTASWEMPRTQPYRLLQSKCTMKNGLN
jgi:hypothetical protein